jgi:hypothetical protein
MSLQRRRSAGKVKLDDLLAEHAPAAPVGQHFYWRLMTAIRGRTDWLDRGIHDGLYQRDARLVARACARWTEHADRCLRTPETWVVPQSGPNLQFRSLVCHLFNQYPVPGFLPRIWIADALSPFDQDLYFHLASGRGVREVEWPCQFRLTRPAAALWMHAPDDLLPLEAVRWAHIRSLGGTSTLARLLIRHTCLAQLTTDEAFWETVIRFFVQHKDIPEDEIVSIVHFIDEQRFQPAEIVWGRGAGQRPLQPEFSVVGRSLMSLRRHIANWQTELRGRLPAIARTVPGWEPAEIQPLHYQEDSILWTIDELLSAKELQVEGGIMQHCVATYTWECSRRWTSIWSLKAHYDGRRERRVTIEVRPDSSTIWQVKGPRNAPPNEAENAIVRKWAAQQGLSFRKSIQEQHANPVLVGG